MRFGSPILEIPDQIQVAGQGKWKSKYRQLRFVLFILDNPESKNDASLLSSDEEEEESGDNEEEDD